VKQRRYPRKLRIAPRAPFAVLLLWPAGCARPLPPPGGEQDQSPPEIIATTPEHESVVPEFRGSVTFRFNERISERGVEDAVLVSPRIGEVKVSRGRTEIRASVEGGWRAGIVYRVVLLPGIRDLFNNERKAPAELVFSTGPALPQGAIAGLVADRITGRPATQVMVEAKPRGDSIAYITAADSAAFFAFRYMSAGIYDVTAYVDQNRNRRRDPSEPATRNAIASVNRDTDTVPLDLAVVPADTSAPRLLRAEGRDSTQVRLFTDDYLDPAAELEFVRATIVSLPDSVALEPKPRLLTVDSFNAIERLRRDSLRADSLRRDTTRADTTGARRPPAAVAPRGTGPLLPYQEFVLVPAAPLSPGRKYRLTVEGLTNISGRSGGGGTIEFEVPVARPPRAVRGGWAGPQPNPRLQAPRRVHDTTNVRPAPRNPIR
jgi:hypothetical protein